jgi:hypothetical protein
MTAYTGILIIFVGQLHVFQRVSSGKMVLEAVKSRFAALNYYENGSTSVLNKPARRKSSHFHNNDSSVTFCLIKKNLNLYRALSV